MIQRLCTERHRATQQSGIRKLHLGFEILSDDFDPSSGSESNRNNV